MANLGHTDTNPVPLCCEQKDFHTIEEFGLLQDDEHDLYFQTYIDPNGATSQSHQEFSQILTQKSNTSYFIF